MKYYALLFFFLTFIFVFAIPLDECEEEKLLYSKCYEHLDTVKKDTLGFESYSIEKIKQICQNFKRNQCKRFIDDILVTTSSCINSDKRRHVRIGKSIFEYKVKYLLFCGTYDNDEKFCPYPNYVRDTYSLKAKNLTDEEFYRENEELRRSREKVFTENCKISECNQQFLSLHYDIRIVDTMSNTHNREMLSEILTLANYYTDNKCDDIKYLYNEYKEIVDSENAKNYSKESIIFSIPIVTFINIFVISIILFV